MTDGLTYEQLLQGYRDLQLRVTRFSATEQALINARDRLDQELELYKRLQHYSGLSLQIKSETDLLRLIAEAIIDILDVEASIVYFKCLEDPSRSLLIHEGFRFYDSNVALESELIMLKSRKSDCNQVLGMEDLSASRLLSVFSSATFSTFDEKELAYEIYFLGAITRSNQLSYRIIEERQLHMFTLFTQQMHSVLAKMMSSKKIEQQVATISHTANELKKLSLIATKSKSGVIITDSFGRIEWVNEAFTKISGYQLNEIMGKKPKDFLQGKDTNDENRQLLSDALSKKEDVETVIVNYTREGRPYYNQLEIISVFDDAGKHINFIALQKDITGEINFNKEILKINSRFKLVSETTKMGIWEWDISTGYFTADAILADIVGLDTVSGPYEEIFQNWMKNMHPDDKPHFIENHQLIKTGKTNHIIQSYRFFRHDNGKLIHLKSSIVGEYNEKGDLVRLIGGTIDETQHKLSEQTLIHKNEELRKINMELDHFVYSISHDLRSPLLSIKGLISLVLQTDGLAEENKKFLNMTLSSASRLDNTIQEILEYSRNSRLELTLTKFDVADLISGIFEDLKYVSENNFQLEIHADQQTQITSDKPRLGVLLKNIIGNSIKYRKPDNDLKIKATITNNSDSVSIVIEDNGEGIAPKHLGKVFNMFYRGTTTSIGTGLGLYICKEIVNKLGGTINIESEQGVGTAIYLELPNKNK